MSQYGNQVTLSPTEMLVLRFRPFVLRSAALLFRKKRPSWRHAHSLRMRCFSVSHMAVFCLLLKVELAEDSSDTREDKRFA